MFGISFNNPNSVLWKGYRMQLAATFALNILTFSHGIGTGWIAPILLLLQSKDTPMPFEVSVVEASWIGAAISVGGMIGNIVFGLLLDRIGRKKCIYLIAIPHMCFWVMVFFTSEIYHLYIARVLAGLTGGGCFAVNPIFISEIADNKIRGTLGSLFIFSYNVGILTGYIISSNVPFLITPCVGVVLPIIYLLIWLRLEETPNFLLRKGCIDAAEKSFKFYNNVGKNETKEALQKFNADFTDLKLSIQSTKSNQGVTLKDFFNKRAIKAILIGSFLAFLNMGTGIFAILNYASSIFAESGSTMNPNTNTIIVGVMQIVGGIFATILVDKLGRRILMLISTLGLSVGMTGFGVYSYLAKETDLSGVSWLPVVIMSFVIFIANIGVVTLTFVLVVEILPAKIRSPGTSICLSLLCVFSFTTLKIFPTLMAAIGLAAVMWMCASISLLGFFFIFVFIKETKGKSLEN